MIKLIGAVLIIAATTGWGLYRASLFASRPRQIRQLIHALRRLATDITYGSTPLPEALGKIGSQSAKPLDRMFGAMAERLGTGKTEAVREVWQQTIRHYWGQTAMASAEQEALLELGNTLGVSDREDQLKHLELAITMLQQEETTAREEQQRYEKLCRSLGLLGGALIVILIY